ncbi:non-hydrolyzing UDP-N-acetylglucosamine 2-epimerase [Deinococcus yavapaiensis]|uniref:UDP-N-acetylglucosamine 2-epimerase (non-hydrolyzing) n=1 Tax=Deinococcus yavapaiensis KR-236 TaxID=694435 RepID=A0A318SB48_9DEIO|nr:UDP-N-acetylglucosamine 2-epimerase (non-hydrolyzing) [Deinococcus yavapaiensis]PYE56609.1 UDP-N-acetylglucosamine 2-epimerase [Deinococcus yavapaiensis KR-236]
MTQVSDSKTVVVAFGTRPEATKMAPVIAALRATPGLRTLVLVTGQHKEQLYSALNVFGIQPDDDLSVMTDRQTLADLSAKIIPQAAAKLTAMNADMVLVHGDTTTTFCMAYAAFVSGIKVGHVEAGLRSGNMGEPFPEEANRKLTDVLTTLDFAPTALSKQNLLNEGKSPEGIFVTGQTAVDAVRDVAARSTLREAWRGKRLVTVTMHRRENLPVMEELALALRDVALAHPERHFVYPVHLNPAVREAVVPTLSSVPNFELVDPLAYDEMAALMAVSDLLATDSGGLQEEGASLGVPVAVLRNVTERPEGLHAGVLKLAGNERAEVTRVLSDLLSNEAELGDMRGRANPYGDGHAGRRIAEAVAWYFGFSERPRDWQPGLVFTPAL